MKHTASVFPHICAKCLASEASSVIGASKVESRIIRLILLIICKKVLKHILFSITTPHQAPEKSLCHNGFKALIFVNTLKKGHKKNGTEKSVPF